MEILVSFNSPFSKDFFLHKRDKSLLLQFILREFLDIYYTNRNSDPIKFFVDPFQKKTPFQKILDLVYFLKYAFPGLEKECTSISKYIESLATTKLTDKKLIKIYQLLYPFLDVCKNDEKLSLFWTKNSKELSKIASQNE